jgi:hypothetical protein
MSKKLSVFISGLDVVSDKNGVMMELEAGEFDSEMEFCMAASFAVSAMVTKLSNDFGKDRNKILRTIFKMSKSILNFDIDIKDTVHKK